MPATAAAAIAAGNMIKFREYPVGPFAVIMNAFDQFSARTGKRILFFAGNQLIQF
jgi:hypothetical protein